MAPLFSSFLLALPATVLLVPAVSQCATQWLPGEGIPGTNGRVYASTMWDRDGAGPASPVLVVGGGFTVAGAAAASRIAFYDPTSGVWSNLGSGMSPYEVHAFATLANGDLVAGGSFTAAGGFSANHVARWDGATWSPLATGLNGNVYALAVLPNGNLVAGGQFTVAGGLAANNIALWDGTAWSAMGSGVNSLVYSLTTLPNGDLVVGGGFSTAGGVAAPSIARWNGTGWSPLGTGTDGVVLSTIMLANGDLIAGGDFQHAGGNPANGVARWDGSGWSALGAGLGVGDAYALAQSPNGDLVMAGYFTSTHGGPGESLARWDGVSWSSLGSIPVAAVPPYVFSLTVMPNGDLIVGGDFNGSGAMTGKNIARWNGAVWAALGGGPNNRVSALTALPTGDFVAGGGFTRAGTVNAAFVARRNGTGWSALGSGMDGVVSALVTLPNGDVVAGGGFVTAGGVTVNHVARWDGFAWSALGSGVDNTVQALCVLPGGDLVAGGFFTTAGGISANRIARWNGTTWMPLGSGINGSPNASVICLATLPTGDLVVGGNFSVAGGISANCIARWNGTSWSAFGPGMAGASLPLVSALAPLANGDLVAGGRFTMAGGSSANNIARWNGTNWSALGSGITNGLNTAQVVAITTLPSGGFLAGGFFSSAGGVNAANIARWDGTGWSALGSGTDLPVATFTMLPGGDIMVGGNFAIVDGAGSGPLAGLTTTCPATFSTLAAGCPSSGGSNTLTVTSPAWVDATFRATGAGLPSLCVVFAVTSLAPVVPGLDLDSVFAEGIAGCRLHVAPDILELLVSTTGTAQSQVYVPSSPPIVGATFYHQMIPFEFDASFVVQSVTATNALALVVGSF